MSEADPDGRLTAEPSSAGVRHPRAFVLGEWAAAVEVRPYAAPKKQESKTQSEYLRHFQISKLRIGLTIRMYPKCSWYLLRMAIPCYDECSG
jgi:hypothetical protein